MKVIHLFTYNENLNIRIDNLIISIRPLTTSKHVRNISIYIILFTYIYSAVYTYVLNIKYVYFHSLLQSHKIVIIIFIF